MGACGDCAARFGMIYLVLLNTLSLLLGVGMIVVGVFLKNGIDKETEVMDFLEKVDFGSLTLKDIVMLLIVVIIFIGVFCIVTSLFGGCGALCYVRCMLITYVVIIVLCIIIEIVMAGFWLHLLRSVNDLLLDEFEELLKLYDGPLGLNVISVGWNFIFILFNCCGLRPVTTTTNDFESLPSDWWSNKNGTEVIPSSCCEDVSIHNYLKYTNTNCTENYIGYHTSGCYKVFNDTLSTLSGVAVGLTALLLIVEILAIVFSIVMTYVISNKKTQGKVM